MVICPLMISCQSVKVIYKTVVPELNPPEFPELERTVNADKSWTVPKESTDLLATFYLRYDEFVKNYNEIKELYEVK